MALISSLGGYLIVRLVDEDCDTVRDIVVPDFWYHEGFCRIPSTGLESKAENKEMFKSSWPSFEVKLLSMHSNFSFKFLYYFKFQICTLVSLVYLLTLSCNL